MKYRIFAAIVLSVLVLNLGGSTFADTKAKKSNASQLIYMLPASDGVVTFNVKRFFGEALPKLLSSNQPMLAKINTKIEDYHEKTGIDVREFDEAVVGVSSRQIADKKYDIDPVVIARGQMTSASLIDSAKTRANGKYREENVGGRVIYIFDSKSVAKATPNAKVVGEEAEVAMTAIDERTVAFGELGRLRMTLERKTKLGSDLIVMLEQNPTAVSAFAARPPAGLKSFIPLDNDELGKNVDSIKYVYGSADVVGDSATVRVTARTAQNAQAKSLFDTLDGLQKFGKAFLSSARGDDKKVYARLVDNAKFSLKANEVMFDLTVPQSDIDILVGMLK